jgi:hypothetical protein
MKRQSKSSESVHSKDWISAFQASPELAWGNFVKLPEKKRDDALRKILNVRAFFDWASLDSIGMRLVALGRTDVFVGLVNAAIQQTAKSIIELAPPRIVFLEALFLPLSIEFQPRAIEKANNNHETSLLNGFFGTSKDSLKLAGKVLKWFDNLDLEAQTWKSSSWEQLRAEVCHLLKVLKDNTTLLESIEHLLSDETILRASGDEALRIELAGAVKEKRAIESLKSRIQLVYNQRQAQTIVSKEEFLSRVDPQYKTQEGFAAIFVSEGVTMISKNPGVTCVQMPDEYFLYQDGMSAEMRLEKETQATLAMAKVHHAYFYRQNLASNYFIREREHFEAAILLEVNGKALNMADFFRCVACISAFMKAISVHRVWEGWNGLHFRVGLNLSSNWPEDQAKPSAIEAFDWCLSQSPEHPPENATLTNFHSNSAGGWRDLLHWVDDLKHLEVLEVDAIFKLMSETLIAGELPLAIIDGDYILLPIKAWEHPDLIQWVFEDFYTQFVYNISSEGKTQDEKQRLGALARLRESSINHDISKWLRLLTPYCCDSIKFEQRDGCKVVTEGEIDALAWFPDEHAVLAIQMKLSNTIKTKRKRQSWIEQTLEKDAVRQVEKDRAWLKSTKGKEWLASTFGIPDDSFHRNFEIHHLILTDNFYHDHASLPTKGGPPVKVISLFEFQMLLRGDDLFEPMTLDWFKEKVFRINQCTPDQTTQVFDKETYSKAYSDPEGREAMEILDYIKTSKCTSLFPVRNLRGMLDAVEQGRFWKILELFPIDQTGKPSKLRCLIGFDFELVT